ncbi:hypothetical protein BGW36DRAFT_361851 [Talaromyces proteolyticus]|uniref:Uncharacterized protein n=1 Tax=Talaromyces proteolyticus TaxID=1131652 RepID=A0AAD4PY88_9EURO|nr:uncharacterized protein BGW36DRAFT_361851 [Talaromyces proteolyticus]KAH8694029.1 hypothetical protein BGW36DRAFT_361851 [Talaromyces proteolyticus]
MATHLDLNIDALKYPDPGEEKKSGSKLLSRVIPFKSSHSKTSTSDPSIPREYLLSDYKIFLILRDFLQPGSTIKPDDAVSSALEVFPVGYSDLRSLNTVCLELAEQIPYDHPSQLKLASFLWLVGRRSKRVAKLQSKEKPIATENFYQHLSEDISDNLADPGDDDTEPVRYINFQSFLAHLMGLGLFHADTHDAERAMRLAFEQDHADESIVIHDAWILGAAQWILWYGQELFKLLLWKENGEEAFEKDKTGSTILKKWDSWKGKFEEATGESGGHGDECRKVAKRAVEIMAVLERVMPC